MSYEYSKEATTSMKIGEVARELGMSVDWLRKAEREGRIPPAKRMMSGWRFYSPEDVAALRRRVFLTDDKED